jgi:hypothetical protein
MDGIFSFPAASSLDERFEIRGGMIVLKSEPSTKNAVVTTVAERCAFSAAGSAATAASYAASSLSLDERFELCRSVGEECIQEAELKRLLEVKPNPICYDGFEPSGRMHIAQGILKSILVNKLTKAGCIFKFYVADWFAL